MKNLWMKERLDDDDGWMRTEAPDILPFLPWPSISHLPCLTPWTCAYLQLAPHRFSLPIAIGHLLWRQPSSSHLRGEKVAGSVEGKVPWNAQDAREPERIRRMGIYSSDGNALIVKVLASSVVRIVAKVA